MSDQRPLATGDVFEIDLSMRWADADMLRHMNNAVYFRFMEEARVQMLAAAGLQAAGDVGAVVVHCSCDFMRAITYPATVRVRLIVEKIGRSSLTQINELFVLEDLAAGPYARGKTVLVCTDNLNNCAIPWANEALSSLGAVCSSGT
ncbi:MAG: acyl-CoA thioesterase [Burkholderiaceae bacterium]|nr:acyl-CoA thioesterase [Burkholderiaceae bacterium]